MVGNSVNYNPTEHNVLVGGANGTFVSVSPSTSGYVLTSNGPSMDPSFQAGGGGGGSDPIGTLKYFATAGGDSFSDYLECDGSVVAQATYPALFAQMGLINGNAEVWTLRDSPYSVTSLAVGTLYLAATSNGAYTLRTLSHGM